MKRCLFGLALALILVGAFAGVAAAAPVNGAHEILTFNCDGQTVTVAVAPGQWAAGLVVGVNGEVGVPYSFSVTSTDTVTGDVSSFDQTKPGNRPGEPVTCTRHFEYVDPATGHTISVDLTVLVLGHGRPLS